MTMRLRILLCMVVAIIAATLLVPHAAAQVTGQPVIGVIACTNNVPNNSTTTANLGSGVDVGRYSEICVQPEFKLQGAGTTACSFKFALSADGTNYATTAQHTLTFAPAGTTTVYTNATITVGAARYIKLASITAADNSAAMTNISVVYSLKGERKDGGP